MDYEIVSTLNEAHRVYIVRSRDDGRLFVKKQLRSYNISVYRTLAEYPVTGIPFIVDVSEDTKNGTMTVVEEYISGRTLGEIIRDAGPLSEKTVISYIRELCRIVEQLHSFTPPIIHRDIKPDNVIIAGDGRLILIDLNAGKFAEKDQVRDTHLMGTPGYSAPEQHGFGASGITTDIYGIGMLMKALLTADASLSGKYRGPLKGIIAKCTGLIPGMRYKNVRQLSNALIRRGFFIAHRRKLTASAALLLAALLFITILFAFRHLLPGSAKDADVPTASTPDAVGTATEPKKSGITAPDMDPALQAQICTSYKGSEGGGLTINRDGSAIYYCPERQYSELLCPWYYSDGNVTISLSKLHCDITAAVKDLQSGRAVFSSDSRNWDNETYEKITDTSFSYENRARFVYDDNIAIGSDGGFEFSVGGFKYSVPKHFSDYPDNVDDDNTKYIFIDANADDLYSGQLYFFHDEFFAYKSTLDDFFRGYAADFAMDFIDNIKVTDISSKTIGDSVIYSCRFTGAYNRNFNGLTGCDAGGIIVFMYGPSTGGIVKILMSQTAGRNTDLTDEITDIITRSAGEK